MTKKKIYKDVGFAFDAHPVTGDLVIKSDEDAIKQSIRNLVLTNFYEVPYHPEIGSNVYGSLFENITPLTITRLKEDITDVITKFEPRAEVIRVNVQLENDNQIRIQIAFTILSRMEAATVEVFLKDIR